MAAVAAGVVLFFVLVTTQLGTQPMTLLFGELAPEDSGRIVGRLEAMNVAYQLSADGAQVMVPRDQVARLRMTLAGEGLPSGGSVGYEIFDQAANFGTTNFVQRLNHVRALEGELARTITALRQVQAARVHLVLPTRELFAREREQPSASIVLKLRASVLEAGQISAIQHLVAAAVPGLTPSRISVIDDRGTLLARGGNENADVTAARTADELERRFEDRLARSVETLLERTVGPGRVRAEVAADLDFDRVTLQRERFDPDGQVIRSTAVEEQAQQAQEARGEERVTVGNNLPGANAANAGQPQSNSRSTVTRETTNFEISKSIETHVREGGKINRISVAVLIDGVAGADGAYQARSAEELERISQLVRSAIGFKEDRGDVVQVVNMPFSLPDDVETAEAPLSFLGLDKNDLLRLAEVGVLGLVSVLLLILVVRPVVASLIDAIPSAGQTTRGASTNAGNLLPDGTGEQLALPQGDGLPAMPPALAAKSQIEDMMNVAKVEGQVRASSIKRITEIVDQHPEETIAIIRNWMVQGS